MVAIPNSRGDGQSVHSSLYLGSDPPSVRSSFRAKESEDPPSCDINGQHIPGFVPAPAPSPFNYMAPLYALANPFIAQYQAPIIPTSVPITATAPPLQSLEDLKLDSKKQKGKRQARPYTREIKDKKKRRLEQNRLSARESRKKKKAYIETLEAEVTRLKTELNDCRLRLGESMAQNKVQAISYTDTVTKMKAELQQMVDKIILACQLEDIPTAEAAFQSLLIRYGVQSEERRKAIETLSKGIIECLIPSSYMYLLWAAQNDSGVFNPENFQPEGFKRPASPMLKDELERIIEQVKLNEYEQTVILKTKEGLKTALAQLKLKVRKFIDSKNELYNEVKNLDNFVSQNITTKLSSSVAGNFFQWMQRIQGRPEFTEFSMFSLGKEDFGGFDLGYPIYPINPAAVKGLNFLEGRGRNQTKNCVGEDKMAAASDKERVKKLQLLQESPAEEIRSFKRPNIFE